MKKKKKIMKKKNMKKKNMNKKNMNKKKKKKKKKKKVYKKGEECDLYLNVQFNKYFCCIIVWVFL